MDNESVYLRKLNIIEIVTIYYMSLYKSFPKEERRPLWLLLKSLRKGQYECLGAIIDDKIVGYAYSVKFDNRYLLDYFAVLEHYRAAGLGSLILRTLMEYYKDADSVIAEVENPDSDVDSDEKELRSRRLDFYYRNGCIDTTVRTKTFGVDFIIIRIAGKETEHDELGREYLDFYRLTVPDWMFDDNVKIV